MRATGHAKHCNDEHGVVATKRQRSCAFAHPTQHTASQHQQMPITCFSAAVCCASLRRCRGSRTQAPAHCPSVCMSPPAARAQRENAARNPNTAVRRGQTAACDGAAAAEARAHVHVPCHGRLGVEAPQATRAEARDAVAATVAHQALRATSSRSRAAAAVSPSCPPAWPLSGRTYATPARPARRRERTSAACTNPSVSELCTQRELRQRAARLYNGEEHEDEEPALNLRKRQRSYPSAPRQRSARSLNKCNCDTRRDTARGARLHAGERQAEVLMRVC